VGFDIGKHRLQMQFGAATGEICMEPFSAALGVSIAPLRT